LATANNVLQKEIEELNRNQDAGKNFLLLVDMFRLHSWIDAAKKNFSQSKTISFTALFKKYIDEEDNVVYLESAWFLDFKMSCEKFKVDGGFCYPK